MCRQHDLDDIACERVKFYLDMRIVNLSSPLLAEISSQIHDLNAPRDTIDCIAVNAPDGLSADQCSNLSFKGSERGGLIVHLGRLASLGSLLCESGFRQPNELPMLAWVADGTLKDTMSYPTIVKARDADPVNRGAGNAVLVPLFRWRFWPKTWQVYAKDMPFADKADVLVWRGTPTGAPCWQLGPEPEAATAPFPERSRMLLTSLYAQSNDSRIDVGLIPHSSAMASAGPCGSFIKDFGKPKVSTNDLLKSKFLLVLDGNDIATQLHWSLVSNSVPFMVKPRTDSWLMESHLKPWTHFVPLRPDFSDLLEKVEWAIANPAKAENIASAGRQYVLEFKDEHREKRISATVLDVYHDRMIVEKVGDSTSGSPFVKCW
jgi:hypothetical protein